MTTNTKKMPLKSCPECQEQCHARLATCKKCGFIFYQKKKRLIEDWKRLKVGDHVRVIGRSGTYYVKENGDKMYFTDPGIYSIREVHKNGLAVVGVGRRSRGYEFLYMGPEQKSSMLDNMYNSPHKLVSVSYRRKGES